MLFQDWMYEDFLAQYLKDKTVRFIEPMSAHEINILDYIPGEDEFSELKYDGHRSLAHVGEKVRVFSRVVSKKTGWFSENTDQVPHIRDLDVKGLFGTVLDGEFDYGNTSMGVQSVMGSKPERAIKFQKENGNILFKAFEILYYKGVNIQRMPLWKRKIYLAKALMEIESEHMLYAEMYVENKAYNLLHNLISTYEQDEELKDFILSHIVEIDSHKELFFNFVEEEKEGIMLKSMYGIYEQKRSKAYLKVKGQSTWDCVIMGYTESTKGYTGNGLDTWDYWETPQGVPVLNDIGEIGSTLVERGFNPLTKPYYMGWCGGISFGVWKDGELVQVGDCKGLTEKIMQDIKVNGNDYIGRVVEVVANGIIDEEIGSLRHPRYGKFRWDKNSEDCVWDDHIRKL